MKTFSLALGIATLAAAAEAGTIRVNVDLKRDPTDKCVATVSSPDTATSPVRLRKSKRDMLTWNITNACTRERLRICLVPVDNGSTTKPVDKCAGDPEDAEPYDEFEMEGAAAAEPGHATISCRVKWRVLNEAPKGAQATKRVYAMQVAVGSEADAECPPRKRRLSELAMEIEP